MTFRSFLSAVALLAVVGLLGWQVRGLLADPTVWPPDDYVQYWAAGRLNLHGQNPYSPELLLPLEREAGRRSDATGAAGGLTEAVMMWNPPWTLPVVMPLGAVPARVGQLVWLLVGLAAVGGSADILWRVYGGPPRLRWVAGLLAGTYVPTLIVLHVGQIGPLLLLGATLFIAFGVAGRTALAGSAAVLLAIKPHLAYLVWPLVLADAVATRRWGRLVGGAVGGLAMAAVPLLFNPAVWTQYLTEIGTRPPEQWVSLTLGAMLRLAFGRDQFWLQFLPPAAGLAWAAVYWWRQRRGWDWAEQTPLLLLVSFVTSPYGSWHFDLVLLLVPMLHRAARLAADPAGSRGRLAVGGFVAVNLGMLGMNLAVVSSVWFAWVAPTLLALYLVTGSAPRREVPPA